MEILSEVVNKFKEMRGIPFSNDRFQLFVDGGVRRATDVLKAAPWRYCKCELLLLEVGNCSKVVHFQWALADPSYMRFHLMGRTGSKRR
jgi:hypothetical protein